VKRILFLIVLSSTLVVGQGASGPSPHPTRKGDEQILQQAAFSPAVADVLVARIGEGFAGHNRKALLSAFDKSDADDYAAIKEQVNAIMEAYRAFKIFYRVESSSLNQDGTVAFAPTFRSSSSLQPKAQCPSAAKPNSRSPPRAQRRLARRLLLARELLDCY